MSFIDLVRCTELRLIRGSVFNCATRWTSSAPLPGFIPDTGLLIAQLSVRTGLAEMDDRVAERGPLAGRAVSDPDHPISV